MRLLIMGPPGAGKGTQAVGIAEHFGIPAISSGAIFRDNIKRETDLGQQVKAIIARGDFVPDELTTDLVLDRIGQPDAAGGYLLDGYPRTVGQVHALDGYLADRGDALDAVVVLEADPDVLVSRMLRRAEIEGREDDNEETTRRRIEVYHTDTAPLLEIYQQRGQTVEVDAIGEVEEVTLRLTDALRNKLGSR